MNKTTFCLILVVNLFLLPSFGQEMNATTKRSGLSIKAKDYLPEFVSNDCQFKVKFPEKPIAETNQFGSTIFRDFKVNKSHLEWRVACSDNNDFVIDKPLKEKYSRSVQSLLRENRKLISYKDIYLNERLGVEFVIEDVTSISITRTFLIEDRLYQVVFKENKSPKFQEVSFYRNAKEFLDSFNFRSKEE